MFNLCLHAGARQVGREVIEACPTPESTPTWTPIPHIRVVDDVKTAFNRRGIEVRNEEHALDKNGALYFGLLDLGEGGIGGTTRIVGIRNSHNKLFGAGVVAGNGVFVCDNLSFMGEVKISRKHTSGIIDDLPMFIENAVASVLGTMTVAEQRLQNYQDLPVDDFGARWIILEAVKHRALPNRDVPAVLEHWEHPHHEEFKERNLWSLYNGFTEVGKRWGRLEQVQSRTQKLHTILGNVVSSAA